MFRGDFLQSRDHFAPPKKEVKEAFGAHLRKRASSRGLKPEDRVRVWSARKSQAENEAPSNQLRPSPLSY
ncbi:MAG: hypothetical protein NTX49_01420 [Chlamydiae bacterium]|nr:hypothetical protein [Chlamydiota bacterium]